MVTLAPKSQSALLQNVSPIITGIEKLPASLSFGGKRFLKSALLSFVSMTVSCLLNLFLFEIISFKNFAYFVICSSKSANGTFICKLLNMFRNFEYCFLSACLLSRLGKGMSQISLEVNFFITGGV